MTLGPDEGVVRGTARFLGGLLIDEMGNGAVFFSLMVVVAAVITQDAPLVVLGVIVGLVGTIVTWRGLRRGWSDSTMALVALTVLAADVATLWWLWSRA